MIRSKKLMIAMALSAMSISTALAAVEPGYVTPYDKNLNGSNVVYEYNPNFQYKVRGKLGYLTDLMLGRNEKLAGVVAGNTSDWQVSTAVVDQTPHVYLKPIVKEAAPTNLIVNTNKRSYRFIIRQDEVYDDVISFSNLNVAEAPSITNPLAMVNHQTTTVEAETYSINTDYKYEKAKNVRKSMIPTSIWDDGVKTYIQIPNTNIRNLPVVYSVDKKGNLSIVNSRLQDHHLVVDTILARLQLRFSQHSYLTIVNNKEAGVKSVKVKDINKMLNQEPIVDVSNTAVSDVKTSDVYDSLPEWAKDTDSKAKGVPLQPKPIVKEATPTAPRIIVTRDNHNNPVEQVVKVGTTQQHHQQTIAWVPLKERIAKLQQMQQEGGRK